MDSSVLSPVIEALSLRLKVPEERRRVGVEPSVEVVLKVPLELVATEEPRMLRVPERTSRVPSLLRLKKPEVP